MYQRPRPEQPGGTGLRIVLLLAALLSVLLMRGQCSQGVANVFKQVAPPASAPSSASIPVR